MIKTSLDFRQWVKDLKAEMIELSDSLPRSKRADIVTKTASELNLSGSTINNYLSGIGSDPETSLRIKEAIQDILEKQNQTI